jgi:trimeric autotransporter adhesin
MRQMVKAARNLGAAAAVAVMMTSCKDGCGLTCPGVQGVTVNPTDNSVVVGRTVPLTANVRSTGNVDTTVTWSSSNTSIATVDGSGVVRGVAVGGPVAVTATSRFDASVKGTASVTVTLDPTGITLDLATNALTLRQGETRTVTVALARGPNYTEAVAVSAQGTPTGLSLSLAPTTVSGTQAGTTLTIAAAADLAPGQYSVVVTGSGSTAVPNTKTLTVNVTPRAARVTVTLDEASIVEGGNTTRAHAQVLGTGGTPLTDRTVTWSSSNPAAATVLPAEGLVTAQGPGSAYIIARVVGEPTVADSARLTVTQRPPTPIGPVMKEFAARRAGYIADSLTGRVTGLWGLSATDFFASSANFVRRFEGGQLRSSFRISNDVLDSVAISGSALDNVYAVGLRSRIIARYNGSEWRALQTATQTLNDVWVGPGGGIAVGQAGTILRLEGETVRAVQSETTKDLFAAWGFADGTMLAAGAEGTLLRWDGTRWSQVAGTNATETFVDIWGADPRDFFVVARSSRIYRYVNGALTPSGGPFHAVESKLRLAGTSNTNLFATGLTLYTFNGTAWNPPAYPGSPMPINAFAGSAFGTPDDLLMGTEQGGVFARRSATAPWRPLTFTVHHSGVWTAPSGRAYITSQLGRLIRVDGATAEELRVDQPPPGGLTGVWGTTEDNVFVVGDRFIGRYDGGALRPVLTTTRIYNEVHGSAPNNVFAVGTGWARFDGVQWREANLQAANERLNDVWVVGPTSAIAVGVLGQSHLMRWDGQDWTREALPITAGEALSVYAASPTAVFVGLTTGHVLRRDGSRWVTHQVEEQDVCRVSDLWGEDANEVYAVTACGRIFMWNGTEWVRRYQLPFGQFAAVHGRPGAGGWAVGTFSEVVRGRP